MNICKCNKCLQEFSPVLYVDGKRVGNKRTRKFCYECCPYEPQKYVTKERVCQHCKKDFFPVTYFQGKRKWLRGRRTCFECVPYATPSLGGTAIRSRNTPDGKRQCRICNEFKTLTEFSPTNKFGNLNSYCKPCAKKKNRKPKQRFKEECIVYKGGSCIRCGYNKCPAALEFHHREPNEKEFSLRDVNEVTLTQKIKAELDKCDLVCSNCHKEIHYTPIWRKDVGNNEGHEG